MTQKEFELINAINCDDLDNTQWGINKKCNTSEQYGSIEHIEVPAHLYIYRDEDKSIIFTLYEPSITIIDRYGQQIDLYFISEEEGVEK